MIILISHINFFFWVTTKYVMRWAIWYHLYNVKNVKNSHGRVLILVKLQAKACSFIKINTPPWVFFTFFKLYKWYQIVQRTTYIKIKNLVHLTSLNHRVKRCGRFHTLKFLYLDDWYFLFLNMPTLKLRMIIIILPTDQPKIILLTAHTIN